MILHTLSLTIYLLLQLCPSSAGAQTSEEERVRFTPSVKVIQGRMTGVTTVGTNGNVIYSFKGIPYAESPTGNRRFRPVSPHKGWRGTLFATKYQPVCPQPGTNTQRSSMSEDCLFINVWTPYLPNPGEPARLRPVVIFLEGQLYTLSNPTDFSAEDFVSSADVVFISVSYRLNAFGFLSREDPVLPGNLGLLDQYLAILWTNQNVAVFGGNRHSVTILGHSAGASSAMYHLISTRSNAYIHKVIALSGTFTAPWASQPNPRKNSERLIKKLKCWDNRDVSKNLLNCLQNQRMDDIIDGVEDMMREGNTSAIFAPVFDDFLDKESRFFHQKPEDALKNGALQNNPILLGAMEDEGVVMAYFMKDTLNHLSQENARHFIRNGVIPSVLSQMGYDFTSPVIKEAITFEYLKEDNDIYENIIRFYSDVYFLAPLKRLLSLVSSDRDPSKIYYYTNSFRSEDIFGNSLNRSISASHGSDLLYLFGPTMYGKFLLKNFQSPREERISRDIKRIFNNFIYTGHPPRELLWEPYHSSNDKYYEISSDGTLGPGKRNKKARFAEEFWYEYIPKLSKFSVKHELEKLEISDHIQKDSVKRTIYAEHSSDACGNYATFTWILLAIVLIIILVFVALLYVLKKQNQKSDPGMCTESISSVNNRSLSTTETFNRRSRWREAITDYRL